MSDYRNESRRRPPSDRYATPGTAYPTANPYDIVITVELPIRTQAFEPALYGTPHPDVPAAVLCYQGPTKGNNADKGIVRIYANPRLAQESYNLVNGDDDANDPAFPVFVRSYLLPRGYTKGTIGGALGSLIGLKLNAGGTGYTPAANSGKLALSFSGGSGSGAEGFAEIVNGAVVAVVLTNSGTGYTGAPTVSIAGGTGASITALLQPTSAKLTNETEQPAEEPFGGYFVRVQRVWETLPGKTVVSTQYDQASDSLVTVAKTKKLLSTITEGIERITIEGGVYIRTTESEAIDGNVGEEIVTTYAEPEARDEGTAQLSSRSAPFSFPKLLDVRPWAFSGGIIGLTPEFIRRVPHLTKTWWVFQEDMPALELNGLVAAGSIYKLQGQDLGEVIYDAVDLYYPAISTTLEYPGSIPSLSSYIADWVGGAPRSVDGSVERDGSKFRWKMTKTYIQFILPILPVVPELE